MAGSVGEAPVAGIEIGAESFGQREIDTVIGGHAGAQLEGPRYEREVRVTLQGEISQVAQDLACVRCRDGTAGCEAPQRLRDLDVEQMRDRQCRRVSQDYRLDFICLRSDRQQEIDHHRCIEDDQRRPSRISRTSRTESIFVADR